MPHKNGPSTSRILWLRPLLIFLVLALCLAFALVMGVFIGRQQGALKNQASPVAILPTQPDINKDRDYQEGYQAALKFAREKVVTLIPGMRADTHFLIGTYKSFQDKDIVVTLDASQIDFFAEGKIDKIFVVSPETFVEQRVDKTSDQYNAEFKKYQNDFDAFRKIQSQKDFDPGKTLSPTPPDFFVVNKISLKDLKAGDQIELTTKSDLESASPFDVVSIRLLPQPVVSANPPLPDSLIPSGSPTQEQDDSATQPSADARPQALTDQPKP